MSYDWLIDKLHFKIAVQYPLYRTKLYLLTPKLSTVFPKRQLISQLKVYLLEQSFYLKSIEKLEYVS